MSAALDIEGMTVTIPWQSLYLMDSAKAAMEGDYKSAYKLLLHEVNQLARAIEELEERLPEPVPEDERPY